MKNPSAACRPSSRRFHLRTAVSALTRSAPPSVFYPSSIAVEFLAQSNFVVENGASVLDSLYELVTFQLPPAPGVRRVAMTHDHGNETGPVTTTGFEPWKFARADAQALVDFVLPYTWGLVKSAPPEQLVRAQPRTP